jgi:hypothetical protein
MLSITLNARTSNLSLDLCEHVTQVNPSVLLINIATTNHATATLQYTTLAATKIGHREDPTICLRGKGKTEYAAVASPCA